jgi:hypothetical protein
LGIESKERHMADEEAQLPGGARHDDDRRSFFAGQTQALDRPLSRITVAAFSEHPDFQL